VQEGIGAEGGETRYGAPRYDNVSDYHGFSMPGSIQDFSNATINGLAGYSAQVSIANGGTDFPAAVPAAEALRITVTVTGPANVRVVLQGYRLRYAPNSP
jgi:MSHA pilin protein MshD